MHGNANRHQERKQASSQESDRTIQKKAANKKIPEVVDDKDDNAYEEINDSKMKTYQEKDRQVLEQILHSRELAGSQILGQRQVTNPECRNRSSCGLACKCSPQSSENSSGNTFSRGSEEEKKQKKEGGAESMFDLKAKSQPVKQFILADLLPYQCKPSSSDNQLIQNLQAKKSPQAMPRGSKKNNVIFEGELSKYMERHKTLVKKYLVLVANALLIYKDNLSFRSFPSRVAIPIPLSEIQTVKIKEINN